MLSVVPSAGFDPGAVLQARLSGFAGFLRANGFATAGADSLGVLDATQRTGVLDPRILRSNGATLRNDTRHQVS